MSGINNDVIMSFDVALFSIYSLIEGILHGVHVLSLVIALVFFCKILLTALKSSSPDHGYIILNVSR